MEETRKAKVQKVSHIDDEPTASSVPVNASSGADTDVVTGATSNQTLNQSHQPDSEVVKEERRGGVGVGAIAGAGAGAEEEEDEEEEDEKENDDGEEEEEAKKGGEDEDEGDDEGEDEGGDEAVSSSERSVTAPSAVTISSSSNPNFGSTAIAITSSSSMSNSHTNSNPEELREQDRYLPIANISRIMKRSLPINAKISKEAKETVQESVSEFISFITSEASDKVMMEKRKTITGDDVLWAMSTLGFDRYVAPLELYLKKYRESIKTSLKPISNTANNSGGGE